MGFPKFTQTLDHTFANKDAPSTSCTPSQSTYRCFMTIQARFVASCKASDLCFRKIRCTLLLVDRARPAQTSPIITYADPARGNLKFASIVSVVKGLLKLPQLCANCGLGSFVYSSLEFTRTRNSQKYSTNNLTQHILAHTRLDYQVEQNTLVGAAQRKKNITRAQ